jgi:hypothetical protein
MARLEALLDEVRRACLEGNERLLDSFTRLEEQFKLEPQQAQPFSIWVKSQLPVHDLERVCNERLHVSGTLNRLSSQHKMRMKGLETLFAKSAGELIFFLGHVELATHSTAVKGLRSWKKHDHDLTIEHVGEQLHQIYQASIGTRDQFRKPITLLRRLVQRGE